MRAIGDIVPVSRTRAERTTSEAYLKDFKQMLTMFDDVPEAVYEAQDIADSCDFVLDLGAYQHTE